jgi:predicted alpha/beta superfamily hydrolase
MFEPSYALAVFFATSCGVTISFAQASIAVKPATIWYSEQFEIHSKSAGRDYLIQVAKPVKPQSEKLPAIYLLDGSMMTGYGYFGDTTPAYVVAIGYPTEHFDQWLSLRNHDLVHVRLPDDVKVAAGSGGGAQFEKFLRDELRPLIESRYPIDPQRTVLAGHSFGGLFALHVLLNNPDAFRDYLICSPAVWAEPQLLQKASSFHTTTPRHIFIGVGSKEEEQFGEGLRMVKNAQELADRLKDHVSGTEVSFTDFEGQTHGTVIAGCLSQGLQIMLPTPPIPTDH